MQSSPSFLDVEQLLQTSFPRQRVNWSWYLLGIFALVLLTSTLASSRHPQVQGVVRLLGGLVMFGLVVATLLLTSATVRKQRAEQQQLESIEELVQLRRWEQAAAMLEQLLLEPARTQTTRVQALIYLASVLARYHRFGDAITLHNYLLEHVEFDAGTARAIKLMRAMAMLHEDRLFDVDREISELRREAPDSAGLALVEMYRDVKTGHPAEAINTFSSRLSDMRLQLGHRLADAYALAARAHDLQGEEAQAAVAFERATLLAPLQELARKYPEFAVIKDKYRPAALPGATSAEPAEAPKTSEAPAAQGAVADAPSAETPAGVPVTEIPPDSPTPPAGEITNEGGPTA